MCVILYYISSKLPILANFANVFLDAFRQIILSPIFHLIRYSIIYIFYHSIILFNLTSLYTAAPVIDPLSPSTVTVNVGDPLTLSCTSRNSPPDTFTWRKDNGPVLQSTTTPVTYNDNSAVFRADYYIDSVTTSDSGTYMCNVTNPVGNDTATIVVVVTSKLLI